VLVTIIAAERPTLGEPAGAGSPPIRHVLRKQPWPLDVVWVPETRCTLCGLLIFVELSAESIAPSDVVDLGSGALRQRS
jgi:hypothetical protein